jgi:hypothetical protein
MKRSKKPPKNTHTHSLSFFSSSRYLGVQTEPKQQRAKAFFPRMGQKEEEGEQVKKIKPSKVNQRNMCLCINIKKSLYELERKKEAAGEREREFLREVELIACWDVSSNPTLNHVRALFFLYIFFFFLLPPSFFTRV